MSKRRKKKKQDQAEQIQPPALPIVRPSSQPSTFPDSGAEAVTNPLYLQARRLAQDGDYTAARQEYNKIQAADVDTSTQALIQSDLGALAALEGQIDTAVAFFSAALELDKNCAAALMNFKLVQTQQAANQSLPETVSPPLHEPERTKIAIVSFLFNWPSTGGGIVHTVELAQFLGKFGYDVCHFFVRFDPWRIGVVKEAVPFQSRALEFTESEWSLPQIQRRLREAVDVFHPDYVIITDSWNIKPLLAQAVERYPYILRLQAMECLCPLNNVRLLPGEDGGFRQCALHQLAAPAKCIGCVRDWEHISGSLHAWERNLSGVGTQAYQDQLLNSFAKAEAVLVVNPLHEAMLGPYTKSVQVVTAGMDPARFPRPELTAPAKENGRVVLLFAGLVQEPMKGFRILHEACTRLWEKRKDFELVATADPPGDVDPFTRFIGWQSQEDLPWHLRAADILIMPTVAQEALGRTAVEAMAAGRPVIASRLGGLPFTVADGATGLLFAPGDVGDLVRKIEILLDDPVLRHRLGRAGRERFEEHYSWDVIIQRHYLPLLKKREPKRFAPFLPVEVDQRQFIREIAAFFEKPVAEVEASYRIYLAFHETQNYARTLGERKTLCFEEAFILYVAMEQLHPALIVEVGTGEGRATRRLLDLKNCLGLKAPVLCFQAAKQVNYFRSEEAEIIATDLNGCFSKEVLHRNQPGLVFLDIHERSLLREAIGSLLDSSQKWIMAIHDSTAGLCNPHMQEDLKEITSATGVWERHVLAECFGVADPLSPALDRADTATHRLCIFTTPHGLALICPRAKDHHMNGSVERTKKMEPTGGMSP